MVQIWLLARVPPLVPSDARVYHQCLVVEPPGFSSLIYALLVVLDADPRVVGLASLGLRVSVVRLPHTARDAAPNRRSGGDVVNRICSDVGDGRPCRG